MLKPSDAKYVLVPGTVKSATDGQEHYITADRLIELYRVPRSECVTYDTRIALTDEGYEYRNKWKLELKALYPKSDGNYTCPVVVWPFPISYGKIPE